VGKRSAPISPLIS